MSAPQVCVGAVATRDGALLLIRRGRPPGRGRWSLPGGRVEAGETVAAAVVREVAEETALEVTCDALVGWVERIGADHHFVILDFAVSLAGPATPAAGDDAAEVAWVPLGEVAGLALVDGLEAFLLDHGVIPPAAGASPGRP